MHKQGNLLDVGISFLKKLLYTGRPRPLRFSTLLCKQPIQHRHGAHNNKAGGYI